MEKIYDMLIVGGGPGGYTAALYGARAGLSVAVLERMSVGGQMTLTHWVDNYPGFADGVDGYMLGDSMRRGAERFGAETILTAFNAEYYYYTGAWYYFLYFLDVETEDGVNVLEALGETLTKAYEAADEKAKEFIRYPYERYQDWEKVLE
jgi:thioredoxin reductase